jgi:hypothetical protein
MTRFVAALLILGCGVTLARAATAPAPGTTVTQAQLDRWLRLWQNRLALAEWDIDARIVRQDDLNPDTLGNLKWNLKSHTAAIKVLDPRDYDMPAGQIPADIERTVVHELVHLELSVLPRNGSRRVEEQVVNRMTEALLGLDHGDNYAARAAAGPVQPRIKHVSPAGDIAARSK